mmetsp:Transcript_13878/g.24879  ORF Transcript_13878/g.24879 Transcript_13878/m.24879 type:complete len:243 (-) Transcript_13878:652-1380(-)
MSEMFTHYEEELKMLVEGGLGELDSNADILTADRTLQEASALLKSLQLELSSVSSKSSSKASLQQRMENSKNLVSQLREKTNIAKESKRSELLSGGGYDDSDARSQRARMAQMTGALERSSDRVKESRRMAAEAEVTGAEVLGELSAQRQTLTRARENLYSVDDELSRSRGIVSSMSRRDWVNTLVIYSVAAVFILACLTLIFLRFKPKGSSASVSAQPKAPQWQPMETNESANHSRIFTLY